MKLPGLFKDRVYCGLDIGAKRIKACLGHVRSADTLDLMAVFEAPTKGLSGTSVNDISELSTAIGNVLTTLMNKTQVRFRDVHLGIGGGMIDTRTSRAVIPLVERGNKMIAQRDIKETRRQARLLGVKLDEDVIHDLVRYYKVDDVNIATDPLGLYGRKLEVESLLVVSNITRLKNLTKAVNQAGFEVNDVYFNGYAVSETVIDRKSRMEGVALVDAGASMTEIMIFKDGMFKHYDRTAWGGDDLTARLARELNVLPDLAEDIKRSYVKLDRRQERNAAASSEEILIKRDDTFVPVQQELIDRIAEPEAERLVGFIRRAIETSGYHGQLGSGVMMIGGGALLNGLMERLERELDMPVRLGRNISGLNNASSFCSCSSIAELAYRSSAFFFLDSHGPKDIWALLRQRLDQLYNDVF